ncbi:MAG TPA: MFS transporter [Candidatus Saccharimonas sp.]|nr:MFS transporter [Candidatus Saccharimonas sp.]
MSIKNYSYKIVLLVLAFTAFVLGTAELMIVGILNPIAGSLQVSVGAAGQLVTGYALGIAIGSPILTALTNRLGRRTVVLVTVAIYVLSSAAVLLTNSYDLFLVARVVAGVMHGMIIGSSFSIASQAVPPQKRGQAIGIVFGGLSVATVLGVPLGTLAGQLLGWQAAFIAVVVMGVMAFASLLLFLPHAKSDVQLSLKDQSRAAFTPGVFITLLAGLLIMGSQFTMLTYLEPFLTTITHIHGGMVSVFLFAYGAACAVGTLIGGKLADKNAGKTIIIANALLIGIFILLYVLGAQSLLAAFLLLAWGFVGFGLVPSYQLYVIGLAGKGANLASTLGVSAVNVGVAVGAAVGGATISALHSAADVPLAAAIVCAVALPVSLFAGKHFWRKSLDQPAHNG